MQLEIGTKVEYKGKQYEVAKAFPWHSCVGCAFATCGRPSTGICYGKVEGFAETFGECAGMSRSDGVYVIFKEL